MNQAEIDRRKQMHYPVKSFDDGYKKGMAIKDVDTSKRIVTGFFNTALYYDSQGDVVMPGAMNKSIGDRGPNSQAVCKIKHAMWHDLTQLPGRILVLEERKINGVTGTYFETQMSNTTLGNDTIENYQEGVYDNHSIGFQYIDLQWVDSESSDWGKYLAMLVNPKDAEDAGYMVLCNEMKLWEGSTVAIGANMLTPYLGSKSGDKDMTINKMNSRLDLLVKQLHQGTQSDEQMELFELQVEQIKQMIFENMNRLPEAKDIARPSDPSTGEELKSFLFTNLKF